MSKTSAGVTIDCIHKGDSVSKLNGWEAGWADLVFADPPFNIGYAYDVYQDKRPYDEYVTPGPPNGWPPANAH